MTKARNLADLISNSSVDTSEITDAAITTNKLADDAVTAAKLKDTDSFTVAGLTSTGDINFGDNDKAIFGAGSDLQIYHDASDGKSYIRETGSGNFEIRATNLRLKDATGGNYLAADVDGAVTAYYDGSPKLATTSTGVDITGTLSSDGLTVDQGGTATINLASSAGSWGMLAFGDPDDADVGRFFYNHGDNTLTTRTSATNRMQIAGNGDISFYEDTGTTPKMVWKSADERLGIGTSSPSAQFTSYKSLNGDPKLGHFYNDNSGAAAEAAVYITNSSAAADGLFLQTYGANGTTVGGFVQDASIIGSGTGASGGLSIMTRANADMRFYTNGHTNERMRIDSSGNVGIGADDPSTKLEVQGVISSRTTNNISNIIMSDDGAGNESTTTNRDAMIVSIPRDPTQKPVSMIHGRFEASTNKINIGGMSTHSSGNWDGTGVQGATEINFYTASSVNTETFSSTDPSMTLSSSGYLGIGTSSPVSTLDVSSTAGLGSVFRKDFNGPVADTFSKVAVTLWGQDHDDADVGTGTDQFGPMHGFGARIDDGAPNTGDIRAGISYSYNGDLTFHAKAGASVADGSYERMRIDGVTGNVGIGTNDPDTPLEISKDVGNTEVELLRLSHGDDTFTNSDTEQAVSVGFELPSYEAGSRSGRLAAKVVARKGGSGANDWYTTGASTNFQGQLDFYTRNSDVLTKQMTINEFGYVGVGLDNPSEKFVVYEDDSSFANTTLLIHNNKADDAAVLKLRGERTGTTDVGQIIFDNSNKTIANIRGVTDTASDDGALQFWTASSGSNAVQRAVIDSDGKFGLKTSSPGYEFDHASDFGSGETKVYRRRYDEVVTAYNGGTGGAGTSTVTVTLSVVGLRGVVLTADFSGSRNNSGPDNYMTRICHALMSESTSLRRSDRLTGLEFAVGATPVTVTSVVVSSGNIVVTYSIAPNGNAYDARMLFTAKGPGIVDVDVSVSFA